MDSTQTTDKCRCCKNLVPLTDAQRKALLDAHNKAMEWTLKGRVPECGEFGAIAQELDYLCDQLAIEADPPQRTWQGLTDEEFSAIYSSSGTPAVAMEKVEAKLREKNT